MISRLTQRTVIANLIATVAGIDAVYVYEPWVDSPELMNKTYAIIDIFEGHEIREGGGSSAPYKRQDRTWVIHVVQRTNPPISVKDNATRAALEQRFDVTKDNIEQTVRLSPGLSVDGQNVILKFGEEFSTVEGVTEFGSQKTIQEVYFAVKGYVIHR